MLSRLSKNRGFLLFEVMIAVVVLAIGVTFVLRSFNSAMTTTKTLQDYAIAMSLLEQKMFDLEAEGIEKIPTEGTFQEGFEKFSWKIVSDKVEGLPLDKVDVSILWNARGSTRRFSAQAYLQEKVATGLPAGGPASSGAEGGGAEGGGVEGGGAEGDERAL